MRLRVTETNFTTDYDWIFKLTDESGTDYYIMDSPFYTLHNIKSPITKRELDYLDKGYWLTTSVQEINGRKIVVSINP